MAKIVIAGTSDCPYFAKIELLADTLSKNLDDFKLHKILLPPNKWQNWLNQTCKEKGWSHTKSPLVWRELIDRGGKGILIGGANEFQEYINGYYGIQSDFASTDMKKIGSENLKTKQEIDKEEAEFKSLSNPIHVCITNASSDVAYNMIHALAKGDVFGDKTEMSLHLFDHDDKMDYLAGIEMEAVDLCCPLLRGVTVASNAAQAFTDCSVIILLDSVEKAEEAEKSDWIKQNSDLFSNYARIIEEVAKKTVKVLVAGDGPVNFNTFMMIQNAPNIPRQNFVAMSRLTENNAKAILADRLKVNSAFVVDVTIWGNANGFNIVDVDKSRVHNYDGAIWGPPFYSRKAGELTHDEKWMTTEFPELVKNRMQVLTEALGKKPTFCRSAAVISLLSHWWNGSPVGQMFSLGVCSEGWYGVPEGMVFSYPVTMSPKGNWNVVQDIEISDELKEKIQKAVKELKKEHEVIYPPPYVLTPTPPPEPTPPETPTATEGEEKKETETDDSSEKNDSGTITTTESETEDNKPGLEKIVEEQDAE